MSKYKPNTLIKIIFMALLPAARLAATALFVTLLAMGSFHAALAQTAPSPIASEAITTPAEPDDSDFLQTPGGRRIHKSCIHEVPDGAIIDINDDVSVGGKFLKHIPKCAYAARQAPTVNGWVEYSQGSAPANPYGHTWFGDLNVAFVVPVAPTSNSGQLIFLFPGLEPTNGNSILQPVLQYGTSAAGGGYFWAMANWYAIGCCSAVHSPLQRVNTGDTITSWIYLPGGTGWWNANPTCGTAGTNCTWVVEYNINGARVGTFWLYATTPDSYPQAVQGTLEAYNVTVCNQFPASPTTFIRDSVSECGATCDTQIAVYPNWSNYYYPVVNGPPYCPFSITTLSNGVTLNY